MKSNPRLVWAQVKTVWWGLIQNIKSQTLKDVCILIKTNLGICGVVLHSWTGCNRANTDIAVFTGEPLDTHCKEERKEGGGKVSIWLRAPPSSTITLPILSFFCSIPLIFQCNRVRCRDNDETEFIFMSSLTTLHGVQPPLAGNLGTWLGWCYQAEERSRWLPCHC